MSDSDERRRAFLDLAQWLDNRADSERSLARQEDENASRPEPRSRKYNATYSKIHAQEATRRRALAKAAAELAAIARGKASEDADSPPAEQPACEGRMDV